MVTRTYDQANRLTGLQERLGHSTGFSYAAADRPITATYPNTTMAGFSCNNADQLTGIVDRANGTPFWSYSYGRDADGQVSTASDPVLGALTYAPDSRNRLSTYVQSTAPFMAGYTCGYDGAGVSFVAR